jgi:hypothetical protein
MPQQQYFEQFPGFEPDPTSSLNDEFRRLALFKKWSPKGKAFKKARVRAFESNFTALYCSNATKL